MPLLGLHTSIAGGLDNALHLAVKYGCQSVQLFTKNASQWRGKETPKEVAKQFRKLLKSTKLRYSMAHTSYLINLASPDQALCEKSVEALVDEMNRAEALGLAYVVVHPGSHVGAGEEAGMGRVAAALDRVHDLCPTHRVRILLETTAGHGDSLGHRFEHLAGILSKVREPRRLALCLDTCHVFAAGYLLAPEREYQATMRSFDRIVGLKWLKAFHLNDSQKPGGSRVDRHAHIGEGHLGLEPFRLLLNDNRFHNRPMILETPKEITDKGDMDAVNMQTLHSLLSNRT